MESSFPELSDFIKCNGSRGPHFSLPISKRHSDRWIDCDGALTHLSSKITRKTIQSLLGLESEYAVFVPVKADPLHVSFSNILESAFSAKQDLRKSISNSDVIVLVAFDTVSGAGLYAAEQNLRESYPEASITILVAFNLSPNENPTSSRVINLVHSPAKVWDANSCELCKEGVPLAGC